MFCVTISPQVFESKSVFSTRQKAKTKNATKSTLCQQKLKTSISDILTEKIIMPVQKVLIVKLNLKL